MAANNQLDVYKIILKKKKVLILKHSLLLDMFKTKKRIIEIVDYSIFYIKQFLNKQQKRYGDIQKVKLVLLYLRKEGKRRIKY